MLDLQNLEKYRLCYGNYRTIEVKGDYRTMKMHIVEQ